ncbi:MAG: hypothetical protein HQL72_07310 [Magnetococcales bacterium]|nr:hypothetical protein [Magnetococcales bacterium]
MTHFQEIGCWQGGPLMGCRQRVARTLLLCGVVMGLLVLLCWPQTLTAAELKSELTITSDRLEMDENKELATFIGGVVAREGEMALFADKMVVHYFKKGKNSGRGGVHQVSAVGHVVIEQAENRGQADRAEYVVGERQLTLIGLANSASILHGGDQLSGKRILLTLGRDRKIDNVSVLGKGKQRVSARILPSSIRKKAAETTEESRKNHFRINPSTFSEAGSRVSQQLPTPKPRPSDYQPEPSSLTQPPVPKPKWRY